MLAKYWRLLMLNSSGQELAYDGNSHAGRIAIRVSPWKFSSGVKVDGTVITDDLGFGGSDTLADAAYIAGAVHNNTTDKFLGATGNTFKVTHNVDAADGVMRLYIETCDDDTSNWPSDADDFVITDLTQVCVLPMDPSAVNKSRSKNFVL